MPVVSQALIDGKGLSPYEASSSKSSGISGQYISCIASTNRRLVISRGFRVPRGTPVSVSGPSAGSFRDLPAAGHIGVENVG